MLLRSLYLLVLACLPLLAQAEDKTKEVFVAVGYGGRRLVSHDAREWKIAAEWKENGGDDSNNLLGVVFAEDKFVAVGGGGGGKTGKGHVLVSADGVAWREVHTLPNRVHPINHGNGRFVAGGVNRKLLWSDDGETWHEGAQIEFPRATHFRQGAFGNGRFLLIGNNGGNSTPYWCATTKDGETIASEVTDLPAVRGLAFGGERFVIVGENGVLQSSADGQKWEDHRVDETHDLSWVVWDGAQFIAGGHPQAYASADGRTWKAHTERIACHVLWADGQRAIGTSWPGQMWHWRAGGRWEKAASLTPNGINQGARGVVKMSSIDD